MFIIVTFAKQPHSRNKYCCIFYPSLFYYVNLSIGFRIYCVIIYSFCRTPIESFRLSSLSSIIPIHNNPMYT